MDNAKISSLKTDFMPFKVGSVFNSITIDKSRIRKIPYTKVVIEYPSRLEAMAIDPSKIAENDNLRYTPGQIDFTVNLFKKVTVQRKYKLNTITISESSKRHTLIQHAAEIMRAAIGFTDGLSIDVEDNLNLRHCGLGSSSGLIASVACAINEMYGNPISSKELVKYLAQNHGEEIDGYDNIINPVQCIGGSAACGTHEGGLVIIAGENVVVKTYDIPDIYTVIIGVPKDFKHPDSKYLMDKEIENIGKFMECGKKYGHTIAYRLFHECIPALEEGNIIPLGDLIYDYRFNMGSIDNCSFVYPPINDISKNLAFLKLDGIADILSLSSVGPGMFAITKDPDTCERAFQENNMVTLKTKIYNGKYKTILLNE